LSAVLAFECIGARRARYSARFFWPWSRLLSAACGPNCSL
jgi:hypothetical protein